MISCDLEFRFENESGRAKKPLRAWIDDAAAGDFMSETELTITRSGRAWRASFDLDKLAPTGRFWLRMGLSGKPGAAWELTVSRQGERREVLLSDADTLTLPKEWLVATCDVRR